MMRPVRFVSSVIVLLIACAVHSTLSATEEERLECSHEGKVLKIGLFSDGDNEATNRTFLWAKAAAMRINKSPTRRVCIKFVELNEKNEANETICNAIKDGISALISVASCSSLYSLIPYAYEAGLVNFVVDQGYCVEFPTKKTEQLLFLDRTFKSDVTQAIVDILVYNFVSDVIILDDGRRGRSVASKLIQKLSDNLVRTIYVKINRTHLNLTESAVNIAKKVRSFGPATWRNIGLHVLSMVDRKLTEKITDEMARLNLLKAHTKLFYVEDSWETAPYSLNDLQQSVHWFELRQTVLRRHHVDELDEVVRQITSKFISETDVAFGFEVFVAAAIESLAKAYETIENLPSLDCPDHAKYKVPDRGAVNKEILSNLKLLQVLPEDVTFGLYRNFPRNSSTEEFIKVSDWVGNRWSYKERTPSALEVISGKHIRIAAPSDPPYTRFYRTPDGVLHVDRANMLIALVKLISYLNATYEIVEPQSGGWGIAQHGAKNWSGAIGLLLSREADVIPFLALTGGRSEVIGFTVPIFSEAISMLVQAPRSHRSPFIFLRPFVARLWYLLLVAVPLVAFALHYIDYKAVSLSAARSNTLSGPNVRQPRSLGFGASLWYIYGALLQQGGVDIPKAHASRLVIAFWWFAMIVIVATYIGNLIGLLAFPEQKWVVNSIDDLRSPSSPIVMITKGGATHQILSEQNTGIFAALSERLQRNDRVELVTSDTIDVKRIINGQAVLIEPEGILAEIIKRDLSDQLDYYSVCRLALAPFTFEETYISFAFRQGSPFIDAFDNVIKPYREFGITQKWKSYMKPPRECSRFDKNVRHKPQITLNDLKGALYVLAIGIAISFLVFALEICVSRLFANVTFFNMAPVDLDTNYDQPSVSLPRAGYLAPPLWTPIKSPKRPKTTK